MEAACTLHHEHWVRRGGGTAAYPETSLAVVEVLTVWSVGSAFRLARYRDAASRPDEKIRFLSPLLSFFFLYHTLTVTDFNTPTYSASSS